MLTGWSNLLRSKLFAGTTAGAGIWTPGAAARRGASGAGDHETFAGTPPSGRRTAFAGGGGGAEWPTQKVRTPYRALRSTGRRSASRKAKSLRTPDTSSWPRTSTGRAEYGAGPRILPIMRVHEP